MRETGSAGIRVPCLVLVGELDLLNPPSRGPRPGRAAQRARGSWSCPASGHMPHVEDHVGFRRELDQFLDEQNN